MGQVLKQGYRLAAAAAVLAMLSACGGGGGGSSDAGPSPSAKAETPAGLWETTYVVPSGVNAGNTVKGVAMVSPSGEFYTLSVNTNNGCGVITNGQSTTTGSAIAASYLGVIIKYAASSGVNTSCTNQDGSTAATGTLTGTVSSGKTLNVTMTSTSSKGISLGSDAMAYTWSRVNSVPASLTTAAGTYKASTGDVTSISAQGVIASSDKSTGCSITGTLSIPNPSYNVYNVSFTYSACASAYSMFNNVTFNGLATFDTTAPATFTYAVNGTVSGVKLLLVSEIAKQ